MGNEEIAACITARNREPMVQTLFSSGPRGVGRIVAPGSTRFFSLDLVVQVKTLARELPTLGLKLRDSEWLILARQARQWGWSKASATAPSGAGSTRMQSHLGSTASGSFLSMPNSPSGPDASLLFTNGGGKAERRARMSSCCPRTRRSAFRRGRADNPTLPPVPGMCMRVEHEYRRCERLGLHGSP